MPRVKKQKSIDGPRRTVNLDLSENDDNFIVKEINDKIGQSESEEEIIRESTVLKDEPHTSEKLKIKFSKFASLVANHNYADVIQRNEDEDVIVSSNLLADLANAHEQEEERQIPAIFIIGVVLGIIITYILLTY